MISLPLFEEHAPDGHLPAFEGWLIDQQAIGLIQSAAAVAVYRDMWNGFTAWCLGHSPAVRLTDLRMSDLQAFQAARAGRKSTDLSLTPRHALRLLRLIDRVLQHHAARTGTPVNTAAADWIAAQPAVRYAEAADADPMPEFLSVSEARHLITFLSSARPRPTARGVPRDAHTLFTWQIIRNRTSVALQLGGGLAPGDVRALTLRSPTSRGGKVRDLPWKVAVPGNGNSPARETPLAPWAAELLQHWLRVRMEAAIPGDFLFPSTRTGKPWSKNSQYLAAKQVLDEAGVDSSDGGSFRLRHTFALRQLRRGTPSDQVARWLGIAPEAMGRYGRVLTHPADVV